MLNVPFLNRPAKPVSHKSLGDNELRAALSDIHPAIVVKINPRARRIALRLDTKNRAVNLVLPKRFSIKKALDFAREHAEWIEYQISALPTLFSYDHGETISLLGKERRIHIEKREDGKRRTDITLEEDALRIYTNLDDPAPRTKRYLKTLAKEEMERLAHEKAAGIQRKVNELVIRDTHSRWGSCSPDGKIMLSWRLIFAPYEAMDYVVAHEVAHLKHLDHSPKFWNTCESLCLNYKSGKTWMRTKSRELMRY